MTSQPFEDLQRNLTRLVRRVSIPRYHDRIARRAGIGIDRVEAIALGRIVDGSSLRLTDLAEQMGVACSTAGRHAAHLAARGMVTRSVDPDDARVVMVSATGHGRAVLDRLRREYRRALEESLGDWGPGELDTLTVLLGRLADALVVPTCGQGPPEVAAAGEAPA